LSSDRVQARKKTQKKTCQTLAPSAKGKLRNDKCPHFVVQKKFKKSEKKACQGIRNLLSLPKPNQTNGETNDKQRTKNV